MSDDPKSPIDLDRPQRDVRNDLEGLDEDQLRAVRAAEEAHGGRRAVLTEIDKRLGKDISEIREDVG